MNPGPVMVDVAGSSLTREECELLCQPQVGGVILFSRNFQNIQQLKSLTAEIRALRNPQLLIAVDHEGGRVQRFREGFTPIPPMRKLGELWERERNVALRVADALGVIIGSELSAAGIDFSFTPVLDLDFGASGVIGDRALSREPEVVAELAAALLQGLAGAGVAAVGKHFPGHGFTAADSHVAIPEDGRPLDEIDRVDLAPYRKLIPLGLAGIMPAHVIYTGVDPNPAGFSPFWLKEVLRKRLGFDGLVFSDDLSMEGASVAGDVLARANAAFAADCDMVLVCNAPESARELLHGLSESNHALRQDRGERMRARWIGENTTRNTRYIEALGVFRAHFG